MDLAVQVRGVVKRYGERTVLDQLDLDIGAGSVCALLGPNGAGKTTTVRILTTLLRPDGGEVHVAGVDVVRDPRAARRRLGLVGQSPAVDEVLSAPANLVLFARLHHLDRATAARRAGDLLEQFGIADAGTRPVREFSGGMRRRLDLAAAFVLRPRVLFLDEPTTGLDPAGRRDVWDAVRAVVAEGTTVLMTTQQLDEAEELADTVTVLDQGRLLTTGTPEELTAAVGGDRLELVLPAGSPATEALEIAARAMASRDGTGALGPGAAGLVPGPVRLTVPVQRRQGAVGAVVRALDEAGIPVDDVLLRPTTLDEAYLRITGHPAAPRPTEVPA